MGCTQGRYRAASAPRPPLATFAAVVTNPGPDLRLVALDGTGRTLGQWLTTFDLAFVAVDPSTDQSAWILPTAERILSNFHEADCRVAWLVTADEEDARRFLGPRAQRMLVFVDPDRAAIAAFGLQRLPAFVHVSTDGSVAGAAEGWDPAEWRAVVNRLAKDMAWIPPVIPEPGDPGPFEGAPASASVWGLSSRATGVSSSAPGTLRPGSGSTRRERGPAPRRSSSPAPGPTPGWTAHSSSTPSRSPPWSRSPGRD